MTCCNKPAFYINGTCIEYSDQWPHLIGHIISCDLNKRGRTALISQINNALCFSDIWIVSQRCVHLFLTATVRMPGRQDGRTVRMVLIGILDGVFCLYGRNV